MSDSEKKLVVVKSGLNAIFYRWLELKNVMLACGLEADFSVTLSQNDFDYHLNMADKATKSDIQSKGITPGEIEWFKSNGIIFCRKPNFLNN